MAGVRGVKKRSTNALLGPRTGPSLTVVSASSSTDGTGLKISELLANNPASALTGAEGIEITQDGSSRGALASQFRHYISTAAGDATPEMFGAVGDGVTEDDDAIYAWLAYCTANNLKAVTTPGKTYRLSPDFAVTIRCPVDATGSEFLATIADQPLSLFFFESRVEDLEQLTLAEINAWGAGGHVYRGSRRIPELANQRGWSYYITTANENVLNRNGGGSTGKSDAFAVTNDDGSLSKPLSNSYTFPLTHNTDPSDTVNKTSGQRRRIREWMEIRGLVVRFTDAVVTAPALSATRPSVMRNHRPHTLFVACKIFNDTTTGMLDAGFDCIGPTNVVYENCHIDGTVPAGITQTVNYGFASSICDDITYRNCSASQCRRDLDSHGGSGIRIDGGNFPDGIGAHWVDRFHVYGKAFISQTSAANPQCIQIAGSDIDIDSALIVVPSTCPVVFNMRTDEPELRGLCRIGPGVEITIDEALDTAGPNPTTIMQFSRASYDCGRAVTLPSRIEMRAAIRQIGAASDNKLSLLYIASSTAALFPQDIAGPAEIDIVPSVLALQGGFDVGAERRISVSLFNSETQTGPPAKVRIGGIRKLLVNCQPANTTTVLPGAGATSGRYDITVSDIQDASDFGFYSGACRESLLIRVNPLSTVTSGGAHALVGDEKRLWQSVVESGSYTPTLTNTTNLNSSSPLLCFYTVLREGPATRVEVFGQFAADATLAASTGTTLGMSLPVTTTFSLAGQLSGSATAAFGNPPAGIFADTTNHRASINWASGSTGNVSFFSASVTASPSEDTMAAGTFTLYDSVAELIADATIDLDNDTFALQLHTSTYTPSAAHDELADLTNEHANGNGYTTGGVTLTGVTWNRAANVATFDSNDVVWTASGGSIAARYAVLIDLTSTNDKLIGYMLLDSTPANVTATTGNTLTIATPAAGWFQLTAN